MRSTFWKKGSVPFSTNWFAKNNPDKATITDVYYCYRLLLNRKPDKEGFQAWKRQVKYNRPRTVDLVRAFMGSPEYILKASEPARPTLVDLGTFQIYVRPDDFLIGSLIAEHKTYEPAVSAALLKILKPGSVFVDIGANVGYFALLAASALGGRGKVIAFEPDQDNCALLRRSLLQNDFHNVELHQLAVADQEGWCELERQPGTSNTRLVKRSAASSELRGAHPIRVVKLDDFLQGTELISLIKLDIEGAEYLALKGLEQVLARHRPVLLFEFSPSDLEQTSAVGPEKFLQYLDTLDYRLFMPEAVPLRSRGLSCKEIMQEYERSGESHLNLVAYPD